jgi:hypothetical protein
MDLIQLVVVLVIIGVALWAIESLIPLDPTIKNIIRVVIILVALLWVLTFFGLLPGHHVVVS